MPTTPTTAIYAAALALVAQGWLVVPESRYDAPTGETVFVLERGPRRDPEMHTFKVATEDADFALDALQVML